MSETIQTRVITGTLTEAKTFLVDHEIWDGDADKEQNIQDFLDLEVPAWMASFAIKMTTRLLAENAEYKAEVERLRGALEYICEWSKAYPLGNFPEPTKEQWKSIAEVLKTGGFSLDRISASNMRHVATKQAEFAQTALEAK